MYAGAASGAVTIGLALFLVLMSQKPNASEAQKQPPPAAPVVERAEIQSPQTAVAVILPPPPAATLPDVPATTPRPTPVAVEVEAVPPAPTPAERPPLKPRRVEKPLEAAEITPLKPRRRPPPVEAPPRTVPETMLDPAPVEPPEETPPAQVARLPETETAPVPVTRKTVKEGRALLKMLETGKGPVIEIAWPRDAADRARLYNVLTGCHGMQTAMLAGKSSIYIADGAPGARWNVNRDAVSGFIRRPAGELTRAEKSAIQRIKTRHGILYATPVRLFPRGVDAVMLGGLGQIVGPGYLKYKTIRARYRLNGNRITVADIRVDGTGRPGHVALPRTGRCRR